MSTSGAGRLLAGALIETIDHVNSIPRQSLGVGATEFRRVVAAVGKPVAIAEGGADFADKGWRNCGVVSPGAEDVVRQPCAAAFLLEEIPHRSRQGVAGAASIALDVVDPEGGFE